MLVDIVSQKVAYFSMSSSILVRLHLSPQSTMLPHSTNTTSIPTFFHKAGHMKSPVALSSADILLYFRGIRTLFVVRERHYILA